MRARPRTTQRWRKCNANLQPQPQPRHTLPSVQRTFLAQGIFVRRLEEELEKVNKFTVDKGSELRRELKALEKVRGRDVKLPL